MPLQPGMLLSLKILKSSESCHCIITRVRNLPILKGLMYLAILLKLSQECHLMSSLEHVCLNHLV